MTERLDLSGRHIVLGLSGGVACYKAADFARELVKAGATVQVVMTDAAAQFITPVTMQALTNRPVLTSQWDPREANNMAHINLTRGAAAMLVAPASADLVGRLGVAELGHPGVGLVAAPEQSGMLAFEGIDAEPRMVEHHLTELEKKEK